MNGSNRIAVSPAEVDRVAREVAQERGVPLRVLRGKYGTLKVGGDSAVVPARRETWRRLARPGVSIASIARAWGCHPTTVLHGLGRLERVR